MPHENRYHMLSCLFRNLTSLFLITPIIRFVGPFLGLVQTWERRLALVSEIIDEWIATQRKWMYLEGIFIGGDMRTQLPDEAAKFDVIDTHFKNVSNIFYSKIRTTFFSLKKLYTLRSKIMQFNYKDKLMLQTFLFHFINVTSFRFLYFYHPWSSFAKLSFFSILL